MTCPRPGETAERRPRCGRRPGRCRARGRSSRRGREAEASTIPAASAARNAVRRRYSTEIGPRHRHEQRNGRRRVDHQKKSRHGHENTKGASRARSCARGRGPGRRAAPGSGARVAWRRQRRGSRATLPSPCDPMAVRVRWKRQKSWDCVWRLLKPAASTRFKRNVTVGFGVMSARASCAGLECSSSLLRRRNSFISRPWARTSSSTSPLIETRSSKLSVQSCQGEILRMS